MYCRVYIWIMPRINSELLQNYATSSAVQFGAGDPRQSDCGGDGKLNGKERVTVDRDSILLTVALSCLSIPHIPLYIMLSAQVSISLLWKGWSMWIRQAAAEADCLSPPVELSVIKKLCNKIHSKNKTITCYLLGGWNRYPPDVVIHLPKCTNLGTYGTSPRCNPPALNIYTPFFFLFFMCCQRLFSRVVTISLNKYVIAFADSVILIQ